MLDDVHLFVAGSEVKLELQPRRCPPWTSLAPVAQSQPPQPLHHPLRLLHHCRPRRLTFPDSAAAAVNSLGRQEKRNPGTLPRIRPRLVPSGLHLSLHSNFVPIQFSSGKSRRSGLKRELPRKPRVLPGRSTAANLSTLLRRMRLAPVRAATKQNGAQIRAFDGLTECFRVSQAFRTRQAQTRQPRTILASTIFEIAPSGFRREFPSSQARDSQQTTNNNQAEEAMTLQSFLRALGAPVQDAEEGGKQTAHLLPNYLCAKHAFVLCIHSSHPVKQG